MSSKASSCSGAQNCRCITKRRIRCDSRLFQDAVWPPTTVLVHQLLHHFLIRFSGLILAAAQRAQVRSNGIEVWMLEDDILPDRCTVSIEALDDCGMEAECLKRVETK